MSTGEDKVLLENIHNALKKFDKKDPNTYVGLHDAINQYIDHGGDIKIKINDQSLYHLCLFSELEPMMIDIYTLSKLLKLGLSPDEDLLPKLIKFEKAGASLRGDKILYLRSHKITSSKYIFRYTERFLYSIHK